MKKYISIVMIIMSLTLIFAGCGKETGVSRQETPVLSSSKTDISSVQSVASEEAPAGLDPKYSRLLLVNPDNPLPSDFDSTVKLKEVEAQYLNGDLKQVDEGMFPYLMALIKAARADGIEIYVRSPYRSYSIQQMLFKNKVDRVIKAGTPASEAEAVAATAVARPGTSEHQTGLAVDFNTASSTFESMPAYKWLKENAEDYGFIMRYPADKEHITKIIYEPWHWRFVGINVAREINDLGVTLEEYLEMK